MLPTFLLDTHIVLRWLFEARKLSREQTRVLELAVKRAQPLAISAVTLVEIALVAESGRLVARLEDIFAALQSNPLVQVLPLTFEIASEFGSTQALQDPSDRVIVATARAHRLRLITSDERIIESGLIGVVE